MNIPKDLKYTKDHEWVRIDGDIATIGVTDFAQSELGDIVFVEIETLDEDLESEEVFGSVEAVKTVSDLFMPVSGKVIEVNEEIESNPELVNTDPYGEGWMIKIEIASQEELNGLLNSDDYSNII
tara:strand:- start:152 stop:526 length:375 start_codon:yes stop_codon:yes gene_type:complete